MNEDDHPTLFGDDRERPEDIARRLARGEHPSTSKMAAKEMASRDRLGEMCGRALHALESFVRVTGRSPTACELEANRLISDGRIRKRLNDLRLKNLAHKTGKRKCRETGRMAYTWAPGPRPEEETWQESTRSS
jgi:hypothetical protein